MIVNKTLHALSNRPGPFLTPEFGGRNDQFSPMVLTQAQQRIQKALLLDVTHTDYYLRAYWSLMYSMPGFWNAMEEEIVTCPPHMLRPKGVEVSGADFITIGNIAGLYVDPIQPELPLDLTYRLDYDTEDTVKLTIEESGVVDILNVTKTVTPSNTILKPNWEEHPFSGALTLNQDFAEGLSIIIRVEPRNFPWDKLVSRVSSQTAFHQMLSAQQLAVVYSGAISDEERAAVALLAWCKSNTSVYDG